MISFEIYKLLHLTGIVILFLAFGYAFLMLKQGLDYKVYGKTFAKMHGISLFIILLGGFGALARLGISWPWPMWVWVKFFVWAVFGGLLVLVKRSKIKHPVFLILVLDLFVVAAVFAIFKI